MKPRLVGISPGDAHLRDRLPWFLALGRAGLRTVVIREPELSDHALDALVLQLWGVVPEVVVHDRHPRAPRYGLPMHLPAHRRPEALPVPWSQSCHDADEVDRALAAGARWVTLSPVWPPTSKPDDARPTLGLDGFVAIAAGRPVLALGGVTPERARELAVRGYGAAVCGPLFGGTPEEGAAACAALLAAQSPVSEEAETPTGNSRSS